MGSHLTPLQMMKNWLRSKGLGNFLELLVGQKVVNLSILRRLDSKDLKKLSLFVGERVSLRMAIEELNAQHSKGQRVTKPRKNLKVRCLNNNYLLP